MTVENQVPYQSFTANGSQTNFALGFYVDDKNHFEVKKNDKAVTKNDYSYDKSSNSIVFNTSPNQGDVIEVQRSTTTDRATNYATYNNSFRPEVLNKDIDRIWLKIQELGVADILLKLYVEKLHAEQKNYINDQDQIVKNIINDLNRYVDSQDSSITSQLLSLRSYVDQKDNEINNYFNGLIQNQGISLGQLKYYYEHLLQGIANIAAEKGWVASLITDASGKNQQNINDKIFRELPSIVDFGAKEGKDFDSGTFIQNAINYAIANSIYFVKVPAGEWMTTKTLELAGTDRNSREGVILVGENSKSTKLLLKTSSDTQPLLLSMSPSGTHTGQGFKGITLRPHPDNLDKGTGIKLVGTCFMEVDDYRIERFNIGQHYYNTREYDIDDGDIDAKNAFCEYNRFTNGRLNKNITNVLFETNFTGDSSFHGNGFYEVQNQVKEGGIGVHLKGSSNKLAVWYNAFVSMNFWTSTSLTHNMTILKAEHAQCSGLNGSIVCEGTGYIRYNNTQFEFEGNYTSLRNSEYPVFEGDDIGVIGGASIRFLNLTSRSYNLAESSSALINTKYLQEPQFLSAKSRNYAGDRLSGAFIKRITNSKTPQSSSYESLAIGARTDCEVFLGEFPVDGGEYRFKPRFGFAASSSTMNIYSNDFKYSIKFFDFNGNESNTNTGYSVGRGAIAPDVTNVVSFGSDTNRFAQGRFQGWDINISGLSPTETDSFDIGTASRRIKRLVTTALTINNTDGIIPNITQAFSLGKSDLNFKDCYLQNAPTVVSDANYKANVQVIDPSLLEAWVNVDFKMWQLKSAITEKGSEHARWHVGYVAQHIKDVLTNAGLNWTKYGLITYESWDAIEGQGAVYDSENNLISEAVEPREAGEIYMLRMEECLVVEAAYQRHIIKQQEARIQQLEQLLSA
ncbi:tail fiber domain-containing protein [Acinetobacter lwoffii]|uniref:tail fiber domain-containing protein n=1 Tax=Acinetobacter lwoffii TaxID=28090 RepID=UPI0019D5E6E2|nr:tail fiber domain-containing protein [Acinetobacter lwoffii]